MEHMTPMYEVINNLRKEGYTIDFNLQENCLICNNDLKVYHDEFMIDRVFRFEGMSDPADEATVYAISAPKHHMKGILVNGAGIYTDNLTDEMLETLKIKQR